MNTQIAHQTFKDAQEAFEQKVQGRLHAFIKETHQGRPAVSCLWNETPAKTHKEVVFVGEMDFDAVTVVRAANKSMKASDQVVSMLIELYTSQNKKPVGEGVEY